jgi:hypothetical protein
MLAADSVNDGKNPDWADVKTLSLFDGTDSDTIGFKLDLSRLPNANVFGINLVVDTDQDQQNGANWWGQQ